MKKENEIGFSAAVGEMKKALASVFEPRKVSSALRDNAYVLKNEAYAVCSALPKKEKFPASGKYPRIYVFLEDYVSLCGAVDTKEKLDELFSAAGTVSGVTGGEVSVFIDALKLVLLKKIFVLSEKGQSVRSVASLINSVRFLSTVRVDDVYARISPCEQVFMRDPVYSQMTRESRNLYRRRLCVEARRRGVSEYDLLQRLTDRALTSPDPEKRHIGFFLSERRFGSRYIFTVAALTVLLSLFAGLLTNSVFLLFASLLPSFGIACLCADKLFSRLGVSSLVPGMKTSDGVPKTLVTVVTLAEGLTKEKIYSSLARFSLANREKGLMFGFLVDLPESDSAENAADSGVFSMLSASVHELCEEYGEKFFACVRGRTETADGKFCGKERKRGAICDLVEATATGDAKAFSLVCSDIYGAEYIVCLDGDTHPCAGSIGRLIGVLEHPCSRPVYENGKVVKGYGCAVPSMRTDPVSAGKTLFSEVSSGAAGTEYYENASYETYQTLFGAGSFAGKGAINVDAFRRTFCSRFADGTLLSHDIIEGEFLRTAYVSDAVFTDSSPSNLLSYMRRAHRWTRGDIQNIVFLFRNIRLKYGVEKNPLSAVSRFKVFGNVLRALSPVFLFAVLFSSLFLGVPALLLGLFYIFFPTLSVILAYLPSKHGSPVRYASGKLCAATSNFLQCLFSLAWLPFEALTKADAAVRALTRLVTRKKLLEWKTSSAVDALDIGKGKYFLEMRAQYVGVFLFFSLASLPLGVLWLLGIPLALVASAERKIPPVENTEELRAEAEKMWTFFRDTVTAETNFLPPDNLRVEPLSAVAERTSPTNIGMYLLSCLGAEKLGFIDADELLMRVSETVSTLEKLEKYDGQILNWYDTRTLKPLSPRFVSTVDNGNLAVCLYTLAAGLRRLSPASDMLVYRIESLLSSIDLAFLFDRDTGLFYIGFNAENGSFSPSHYDFYESEIRLTVFYAVATGQVPYSAWRALDRAAFSSDGVLYARSWSGTMFEYLLPTIFLPTYPLTFDDAALARCVELQKKTKFGGVWGVSESQYYAFDKLLNYQYQAFGIKSCAVDPAAYSRKVVSPYSTLLALPFDAPAALKNLEKLKKLGVYGDYGFYEAVDFTDGEPKTVKSYMSHHIGMSFLSIVGYLCDNIIQKTFFDTRISAFSDMLKNAPPFFARRYENAFVSAPDTTRPTKTEESLFVPLAPKGEVRAVFGKDTVFFGVDSGESFLSARGVDITRRPSLNRPAGLVVLRKNGTKTTSFSRFPIAGEKTSKYMHSDGGEICYTCRDGGFEGRFSVCCDCEMSGAAVEIAVRNNDRFERKEELIFFFEPTLCGFEEEKSHPLYSALFIEFDVTDGVLVCRRRKRTPSEKTLRLAVGLDKSDGFSLCRFETLSSQTENPFENIFNTDFNSVTDGAVSPCVALKYTFTVRAGGTASVCIPIAVGENDREAVSALRCIEKKRYGDVRKAAEVYRAAVLRARGIDKAGLRVFDDLCAAFVCDAKPRPLAACLKADALFRYGISDDLRRFFVCVDDTTVTDGEMYISVFAFLRSLGAMCELVVYCFEPSVYSPAVSRRLKDFISNSYSYLDGCRGGVFIVCDANYPFYSTLAATSYLVADLKNGRRILDVAPYMRPRRFAVEPLPVEYLFKTGVGGFVKDGFGSDDIKKANIAPWSNVLCNGLFSTVLTDRSLGYTADGNSQLEKLTPWLNDTVFAVGGEQLLLAVNEKTYDLCFGASVLHLRGRSVYRSLAAEIESEVTVFVPVEKRVKIIRISIKNPMSRPAAVAFFPRIILGSDDRLGVRRHLYADHIEYENVLRTDKRAVLWTVGGSVCDGGVTLAVPEKSCGKAYFLLGGADGKDEAKRLVSSLSTFEDCEREFSLVRDRFDNFGHLRLTLDDKRLSYFVSTFLEYQVRICRMLARTSLYQCGGAFGFRDQLQDAESLAMFEPSALREMINKACAAQFEDGDVLHWWHDGKNGEKFGVRTRCGDDLLWLAHAVCLYVRLTEDTAFLSENIPFVHGQPLADGEHERFSTYARSDVCATVYEHCLACLHAALKIGEHGLILFGTGDWNDGMNAVGREGKGESVWTTLFAALVLRDFSAVAEKTGDDKTVSFCLQNAVSLARAVETHAWNGTHYIRGFYDDGTPVGKDGCSIDILVQSFAALCGSLDRSRVETALNSALERLVDKENGIVRLFDPPFTGGENNPGYIGAYIPGVRENGGQYTHAAVWFCRALFSVDRNREAYDILRLLNPVAHTMSVENVGRYRKEPYVLAADVYTNRAHYGMGGWTWYTGSAGWYLRCVYENVLGITRRGDRVFFSPPPDIFRLGFAFELLVENTSFSVTADFSPRSELFVDGVLADFAVLDGKHHSVEIYMKK